MPADPQTYAGLQEAVVRWLQDPTLTSVVPEMIALGERRMSRNLYGPDMEASTSLTLVDGATVLPSDLMEIRSIYTEKDGSRFILEQEASATFNDFYSVEVAGWPMRFMVSGSNLYVRPYPDGEYTLTISYKQQLTPLSVDNPTNWLLTQHSDLYLYNTLAVAELFGWNDARAANLKALADELTAEVNKVGRGKRYGNGPLVARAPVGDLSRRYAVIGSTGGPASDGDILVPG